MDWKRDDRNGLETWSGWVLAGSHPDTAHLSVYDARTGKEVEEVVRCNLDSGTVVVADLARVKPDTKEAPTKVLTMAFILRHTDGREWRYQDTPGVDISREVPHFPGEG